GRRGCYPPIELRTRSCDSFAEAGGVYSEAPAHMGEAFVASQQPPCVICGAPCTHGQSTMSLGGALVHVNCDAAREQVTRRIADFLHEGPRGHFCSVCLAAACSLPYQAVAGVVAHLLGRSDVRFVIGGFCVRCENQRITIGVKLGPELVPQSSAGRLDTG